MSIVADPPLLISNAQVRSELNLPPDDDSDLSSLQIAVIQQLEAYIGRYFARRDDFVWTYRVRQPRKTLYLGILPTLSISEVLFAYPGNSIASGTELIEGTAFEVVDQYTSQVQRLCSSFDTYSGDKFNKGYLRFTMNGGWGPAPTGSPDAAAPLPNKIKQAIITQLQFILQRNSVSGSKLISSAMSIGEGGSVNLLSPKNLHPQAQAFMDPYKQFWQ